MSPECRSPRVFRLHIRRDGLCPPPSFATKNADPNSTPPPTSPRNSKPTPRRPTIPSRNPLHRLQIVQKSNPFLAARAARRPKSRRPERDPRRHDRATHKPQAGFAGGHLASHRRPLKTPGVVSSGTPAAWNRASGFLPRNCEISGREHRSRIPVTQYPLTFPESPPTTALLGELQ